MQVGLRPCLGHLLASPRFLEPYPAVGYRFVRLIFFVCLGYPF